MHTFPYGQVPYEIDVSPDGQLLSASMGEISGKQYLRVFRTRDLLDGTVEAVNQATMSAQTAGRIAEVFFDVDDYVQAGEPIVRFTDIEQQSALRQAQAAMREADERPYEDALAGVCAVYRSAVLDSKDGIEGLNAFLEKREPAWTHQ